MLLRRAVTAALHDRKRLFFFIPKVVQQQTTRALLTTAHDVGPTEPPLLEQTIPQHFASIVSKYGHRTAVISRHQNSQSLSYHLLDAQSNSLARGLQSLGIRKGDRVSVSLGNNLEFAILTYALFKLGAILNPLNPSFNEAQVVSALRHLGSKLLIIGRETRLVRKEARENRRLVEGVLREGGVEGVVVVENSSRGGREREAWEGTIAYSDLAEGNSTQTLPDQKLEKHDVVNIQFTSGTTSSPKAACLSHRSILNNGAQIGDRMLLTPEDVVVCPPPLFHCFGCILGYMATATHGSTIVFPSEAFSAEASLRAVQEFRGTALYGVATMFLAELELLANGTVPNSGFEFLRTGIAAGSSVPAELMRKLHRILNLEELTICYGMTETSPVSFMTRTDDALAKRIETVGRLQPHVEAKILDPTDHTRILQVGERGELAVSGYLVMKEYYDDPVRTRQVMLADPDDASNKRWMLTGDEASMDAEGYVSITGRIKDLIIRGGENIHPLEIENCLLGHERVREVSCVGLPDERYGEVVAVFVVQKEGAELELGEEEVRGWVRERLSGHLVPKYVFWVSDYPKTASGKIQKFKLREEGIRLVKEGKGTGLS
ncbi:acetyl- synthetase [Lecanosticta acicola]|uniref:Acetyl- synthetase n=1 Tax=Lecanosticta acicola TaxID=111012 RepID=A0AAI8Z0H8_9PEZI|nr:acetyl- synthetase [Lecanosticta acicola]